MTPEQKAIRSEWRNKEAQSISAEEFKLFLKQTQKDLIKLAGGQVADK